MPLSGDPNRPQRLEHTLSTSAHPDTHTYTRRHVCISSQGGYCYNRQSPRNMPPPSPLGQRAAAETICSLCRLGSCNGGLSKGGGRDVGGAGAAKAWLAQKPMRFNLDNGPGSQLLQWLGRGWKGT